MIYFFIMGLFFSCFDKEQKLKSEQAQELDIYLADPTVFLHEGVYYLYGTVGGNANDGFTVYTSTDMKEWQGPSGAKNGFALSKRDAFGMANFWAPQVFFYDGKFYMAYTANENIAFAESNSPLGPFTNASKKSLEAPVKLIDPYVYIDDDGKKYLYHVRLADGNSLFVSEISDDFSSIKIETLKECIIASEPWENSQQVDWPVAEGPSLFKRNGLYYFLYSANDFRNPDYAVGYATSTSPLGPWEKQAINPILSRANTNRNGSGHGDVFYDKKGEMHYVFHTHYSNEVVSPRKTAIIKLGFIENASGSHILEVDEESLFFPKVVQKK